MAKTNANFNLSKSVKIMLATITDKGHRNLVKRLFIDAEHAKAQPFRAPKQGGDQNNS
jgi:hypothetical protein